MRRTDVAFNKLTMSRRYAYVGPDSLAHLAQSDAPRTAVSSPASVRQWAEQTEQLDDANCFIATFVVDVHGVLWIADRHTEHIACARGGDVLSAGEILFRLSDDVEIDYVSNQSTGYCPEPESWPAIARALERAGITSPASFSNALQFRRCEKCGNINVIKDDWFECAICGAELPTHWNLNSR